MKKMSFIALIAVTTTILTGCGKNSSDADSKKEISGSTTTVAVEEEPTATEAASADSTDTTETTASSTEENDTNNTQTETQTEHSADDPANKGGHEPSYDMQQYAVNDIDALNNVLAMYGGKGLDCDESDTITADVNGENIIFSKVSESNTLGFSNTEDVKNYIKLSLPESEYSNYMNDFDRHFKDDNGSLYMNTNVGRAFYSFSCNTDDMIFTDITGDSFTVTYKEADQMFGMGYVYFQKNGESWKISGFEFK